MTWPETWLLAVIGSLLLVAVHGLTPLLEALNRPNRAFLGSLAGGVTLSYVVLYLLFQLTKYGSPAIHRFMPIGPDALETLFIVLLFAVAVAYMMQIHLLRRSGCRPNYAGTAAFLILYNLLAGGALVEEAQRGWNKLGLYVLAVGLHMLFNDRFLSRLCPASHRGAMRGALIVAPLLGCLVVLSLAVPSGARYMLLALVAGVTTINAFRLELPGPDAFDTTGFLAGMLFCALVIFANWQP